MDINEAIVRYGTEAVLRYRTVAGILHDNEIPEIFLGGFIGCGLYDGLNVHARVERLYTVIAIELGVTPSRDLVNGFGGCRADVAIYQDRRPVGIVELKVFDEGTRSADIVADRDKMGKLSHLCSVECYLGVLVTDTQSSTCTERASELGRALDHEFNVIGAKQRSVDGNWQWCFASGRIG
jgi:hypothetical protein